MCLMVVAAGACASHPLLIAANRDELHQRPTEPAQWWAELPDILGGRDAVAGGSWLAVDRQGRVAAVTNVREAQAQPSRHSRGWLVRDFLSRTASAEDYAASLELHGPQFAPFNLLLIDPGGVRYVSNRAAGARLARGIHALSNAPLGTPWPKVEIARRGMSAVLEQALADPSEALFDLLATREAGGHADRHASALFIQGDPYGTRSSTVVMCSAAGKMTFIERRFDPGGNRSGESRFSFEPRPARA